MVARRQKPIYAFIDSQNLNLGVRSQGWKLDFPRFQVYLKDKFKVSKAFLFIGFIPKHKNLYHQLTKVGYHLIYKPVVVHKFGGKHETKGNVDAELVLHTMIQYPNYSKAVIVSGDGDFHCLIEYLLKQRKLARLIVPDYHHYSSLLRKFITYSTFLNSLKNKLTPSKPKGEGINLRTKP